LGRALGETMAVTMVIGNRPEISLSLFKPAATMASVIANEYAEAQGDSHMSALAAIGLVLLLVSSIVNIAARWIIKRTESKTHV
jgi:phosphate transport system permease protein